MMTELNNIIFEGIVTTEPEVMVKYRGTDLVGFMLANRRGNNVTSMRCFCSGELGDKVMEAVHRDMVVRVVGRIMLIDGIMSIVINHVEYRLRKSFNVLDYDKEEDDEQC